MNLVRAWLSWLAFAVVLSVAAGARAQAAADADEGPSHLIFPAQRLPLRFSHAGHLAIPSVTCARCHAPGPPRPDGGDDLLPREATCAGCHPVDRAHPSTIALSPRGGCDLCHEGWTAAAPMRVARVEVPVPNLHFAHARHADVACERCHATVRTVRLATRLELPGMRVCIACHRPGGARDACIVCHVTQPDGRLRTRFEDGVMNPPRWMTGLHHDADFWVGHRASAAQDAGRCAVCHSDGECAECHDGRARDRRTHPNDYVTGHAVDARMNADRCGSCHRASTFCASCHQRSGVAPSSPVSARGFGRFHPPAAVWTNAPMTSQHHGVEARRSMRSCTSCHSEQDCVTCHASRARGGGGFSPHPPSFVARCGALLRASERPCAACHDDLDALRLRCR